VDTQDLPDETLQSVVEVPSSEEPRLTMPAAPMPAAAPVMPAAPMPAAPPVMPAPHPGHVLEGVTGLRDTIFEKLVSGEHDVIGLLAYSLSMQNKRDWLAAFKAETGRDPNNVEMTAYDIGERIERRLTTYRKLAEHALSGNSFWASASLTPVSELPGAPVVEPAVSKPPPTVPYAPPTPMRKNTGRSMSVAVLIIAGTVGVLAAAALAARHYLGV
jgi:hypothetical protein